MEFGSNFMNDLERPPTKDNLTIYNIIELILMLCIGCAAGYNLYSVLSQFKFSLANLIEIIVDALLFIGIGISIYGFSFENNGYLKGGFIIFYFGCLILLVKIIIDWFKSGFSFSSLVELLILILLVYMINKQIQHI